MIFDLIFSLIILGALFNGYKNGLVVTIVRTVFFIAGGIAGMYFVVEYNKSGWLILAIVGGAYAAAFIGTKISQALRITVIRGPLRIIDNSAGALFEAAKYVLLFYVVGTILLWAPWAPGQNSVSDSKVYLNINSHAPSVLAAVRKEVEKRLA